MAFRSMEEFREMYKRDPQRALNLVDRAAISGKDPVNKRNPGYSNEALKRRMMKHSKSDEKDKKRRRIATRRTY